MCLEMLMVILPLSDQPLSFCWVGLSCYCADHGFFDLMLERACSLSGDPFGNSRSLDILNIVHQVHLSGVLTFPLDHAGFPVGGIQQGHVWWRTGALEKRIEAPSIEGISIIANKVRGAAAGIGNRLPKPCWLVGLDPSSSLDQQSADPKGTVANISASIR